MAPKHNDSRYVYIQVQHRFNTFFLFLYFGFEYYFKDYGSLNYNLEVFNIILFYINHKKPYDYLMDATIIIKHRSETQYADPSLYALVFIGDVFLSVVIFFLNCFFFFFFLSSSRLLTLLFLFYCIILIYRGTRHSKFLLLFCLIYQPNLPFWPNTQQLGQYALNLAVQVGLAYLGFVNCTIWESRP